MPLVSFALTASIFALVLPARVFAFAGGAGTIGDPYQITTPAELASLSSYLGSGHSGKYFKLMNDIDLGVAPYNTGNGWTPIGSSSSGFYGKLDGNRKVVSNLFISRSGSSYQGLFGQVASGGKISNLGLESASITAGSASGTLAGNVTGGGTVEYSYATGSAAFNNHWSGGMVGSNYGTINQSYSLVNVTSSGGQVVGSLAGENFGGGVTSDSYARGSVTTNTSNAGGLLGNNYLSTNNRSYATGLVSGFSHSSVRGLVGGQVGTINNGYWDTQTTGQSAATSGATGLATSQMKDQANYSGWDFTNVWAINPSINDGYPYLRWQVTNNSPSTPTSLGSSSYVDGSWVNDSTPTLSFTLSDSDGGDTVKFQIQIDDSSDFSSPVVNYTSVLATPGTTSFTVGQAEGSGSYTTGNIGQTLGEANYYWRIKAIDNSGAESSFAVANSGAIAFKLDSSVPTTPGTPITSTPTSDTTPTWSWDAASDANSGLATTAYTLQWSQSPTFASGVSTGTSTTNSFTHSASLTDGTWYFRQLATDNAGNNSSYPAAGSVMIDTTAPSTPGIPSVGTVASDDTPTWNWVAANDSGVGLAASAYSVEWSQSPTFASGVSTGTSTTNSFTHTSTLADGVWYFRVKAIDSLGNMSNFSVTGKFNVTAAAAISLPAAATVSANVIPRINNLLDLLGNVSITQIGQSIVLNNFSEFYNQGTQQQLRTGSVLTFCRRADVVCPDTELHTITITNIDIVNRKVTVLIQSNPIWVTFAIAESKEIDVDGDGQTDVIISLNDIQDEIVRMAFKSTALPAAEQARAVTSDNKDNWWSVLLLAIISGFVIWRIRRIKHPRITVK